MQSLHVNLVLKQFLRVLVDEMYGNELANGLAEYDENNDRRIQ